ncbi:MAG: MATE family efflux transporter [Oscillospiraceae bacterium]|nr:MATE family efflux transporter [Oscillospiraceae bacterium]MBQ5748687.1 MATE family efflux transporter [Oscillospiraceae bacterium]
MTTSKTKEIDMLNGRLLPKILLFSLPLAASSILQLLFNAADTIIVGKFAGNDALAAVGSTAALVQLLVGAFLGFSLGANITVARRVGSGDNGRANRAAHTAVVFSAILGIFLMAVGLIFSEPLLRLMDTPENILPSAALYLRIYFLGIPASLIYNFAAAVLRAVGDTRRPLLYLTVSGVVNVVLNLVFVICFHMDVVGVAIATAFSQVVSMVLIIRGLMLDTGACRFRFRSLCMDAQELSTICRFGIPACLQNILVSSSDVLIQSALNSFGSSLIIAANSATGSINSFTWNSMNAVSHAATSFASQNFAAGNRKRVAETLQACLLAVTMIALPMSGLPCIFHDSLLGLYLDRSDPNFAQILQYGSVRMFWVGIPYFLCGYIDVLCGMVRGLGSSWLPTIGTLTCTSALRVIWIFTIFRQFHTLDHLYLCYPASFVATLLFYFICYIWQMKHYKFPKTRPMDSQKEESLCESST